MRYDSPFATVKLVVSSNVAEFEATSVLRRFVLVRAGPVEPVGPEGPVADKGPAPGDHVDPVHVYVMLPKL